MHHGLYRKGIPELVRAIQDWQRKTFPSATRESVLAHMKAELSELKNSPDDPKELADIFLLLVGFVGDEGVFDMAPEDFLIATLEEGVDSLRGESHVDVEVRWEIDYMLCMSTLLLLAARQNVDIFDAAWDKLKENKQRKWGEPNDEGYVEHVGEPV